MKNTDRLQKDMLNLLKQMQKNMQESQAKSKECLDQNDIYSHGYHSGEASGYLIATKMIEITLKLDDERRKEDKDGKAGI